MANYVKITDYQAKDSLTSGNPSKIIQGAEINDEFNAIQTAIASKADSASPTFTGNPTTATQPFGNNSTRIASTAFVQQALQALYPVGTIYTTVVSTNPASIFGFGTWVAFATGRTLIGVDTSETAFNSVEKTGGSKDAVVVSHTHTASSASAGEHTHTLTPIGNTTGGGSGRAVAGANNVTQAVSIASAGAHTHGITVDSTGGSGTNANLPPYITVYFWKRTV
jgi:hypothetical protein